MKKPCEMSTSHKKNDNAAVMDYLNHLLDG